MRRPTGPVLQCAHCSVDFQVPKARAASAKFCSRACADTHPRPRQQAQCRECGTFFAQKNSQSQRNTAWGSFCSAECIQKVRTRLTAGAGNSNWKGRNFDENGYRKYVPHATEAGDLSVSKLHQAVALRAVGLAAIPKGLHVHHKDCDIQNNAADNLQFITPSDHKWLHHQFGVATLRAVQRGQISAGDAADWSDDPVRAAGLLLASATSQGLLLQYLISRGRGADLIGIATLKPVRCEFVLAED